MEVCHVTGEVGSCDKTISWHLGLDDLMAQHIAHLFIRDPISLFAEKLEQDINSETDHFEVSDLLIIPSFLPLPSPIHFKEHSIYKLAKHEV